jgi:hypothetical protein
MAAVDFRAAASALLDRFRFFKQAGISFGGNRDTYQILGYERELTYQQYRERYARGGIAKRLVEAYPNATWRGGVELYEDEDPNIDTQFEAAWHDIEAQHNVWARLRAVDILSGLSTYAVLLIGAPVEASLSEPLPNGKPGDLLYLTPFSGGGGPGGSSVHRMVAMDADCTIEEFELDPRSPRFGEPKFYRLKRTDINAPMLAQPVHWTRILHVAEGCLDDNVYGQPTLEAVYNLLDDLDKVTGGGAEAFWLRANQGLHLDVDKDMGLPNAQGAVSSPGLTPEQRDALREKAEELQHQLQRVMVTRGVTATQLGSDVANFGPSADAILTQIAGTKGIPKRILTGSEMGTLASEQDTANFDSQVQDRRTGYAGPYIVRRLVDRLIEFGYLPTPERYEVGWPVEENMDEGGKAAFALSLTNANKTQGSIVFTDEEIRDMAFDKEPLTDDDTLTAPWRVDLALKMATTNKTQGAVVFTDDEIRETCYGWQPLAPEEKIPLTAPERVSATAPTPEVDAQGKPIAAAKVPLAKVPPALKAAEDAELVRVLAEAIEAGNAEVVHQIIGLGDVEGHEFHGNQWTDSGWSASKGGVLYHGTSESPQKTAVWGNIEDRPMFLTTNHDEAKSYADQVHRFGAFPSKDAHIIEFDVQKGKQLDVNQAVVDALENGEDPEKAAIDAARKAGADFAVYDHPSGVAGKTTEQRVVIALNPRKSLSYKRAQTTAGRFLQDGPHKLSSTQIDLPDPLSTALLDFGRKISDDDLYEPEGGRETRPHVTVKYGLPADADVPVLNGFGPVTLTFGKTDIFATPDYDVLFVSVDSPDLVRLNSLLGRTPGVTDTHPNYRPHATIAYLKSGKGAAWVGQDVIAGLAGGVVAGRGSVTVDEMTFVSAAGERTRVALA